MEPTSQKKGEERREKLRFPIRLELRYKLVEDGVVVAQGVGETMNIGSGGVLFAVGQPLQPDTFVELSISWPVLLEESTRMRLVVFGRLLRSAGQAAACTLDKYEFRTQARSLNVVSLVRQDSMLERWVGAAKRETMKASGYGT